MLTVTLHEEVSLRAYAWGLEESNISCRKEVRKRTAGEPFGPLKPALSVLTLLFSGKFLSLTSKCGLRFPKVSPAVRFRTSFRHDILDSSKPQAYARRETSP